MVNPLTQGEAKVSMKEMTPIVRLVLEPAVIVVKADAPYKDSRGFHRRRQEEPRTDEAVRWVARKPRFHGAPLLIAAAILAAGSRPHR